jgi:antirestriction protein ArdC
MKGNELKEQVDEALGELAQAVEQGRSEQLRAYLSMLGRFHRYSIGNVLLIAMQRQGATHVAGFRAWQRLGRQVKAGERAIRILAPVVWRKKRKDGSGAETEEELRTFKAACVFDVTQTEGKPLAEFAQVQGEPGEHLERLKSFIASRGIELAYSEAIGGAEGYSAGGRIVVRQGLPVAEEFSVIAHELGHEMLHRDEDEQLSRTVRETEAEAVAFVVCQAVGLDARGSSADYIHLYRGSKEMLLESLQRIREVAVEIIEAVTGREKGKAEADGVEGQEAGNGECVVASAA